LIKWKMDLEMGHHLQVDFGNPDFIKTASKARNPIRRVSTRA